MTSMKVPLTVLSVAFELLGVELDDELLADGHVDVVALREVADGDLLAAVAGLEPADDVAVEHVDVVLDRRSSSRAFGDSVTTSPLRTR